MIGMFGELEKKIEHMAMGVTFAEDGHKTKDVAFETESFAVGMNQRFAGELRGSIERSLNGKGSVFWSRDDAGFAIHRTRRGKGNGIDAVGPHGFEHIESGDGVLFEV